MQPDNPDALAPDQGVIELVDLSGPAHLLLHKERKVRVYIEGCEVLSSDVILLRHEDVLAVRPFPRTKTNPSIEFQCLSGRPKSSKAVTKIVHDEKTRTTRIQMIDWSEGMGTPPFKVTTYRDKIIMGMIHLREAIDEPLIWSLTYTLFYAFNAEPKPKH